MRLCKYIYMYRAVSLEQTLKALADLNRLRLLNLLLRGELCVCDLQYVIGGSQPNVSRHLTYMRNAGLVGDRREGQRIYYRVAEALAANKPLIQYLEGEFRKGEQFERDLHALRRALKTGECSVSMLTNAPADSTKTSRAARGRD
jgi:ArsR family transcriptional regulator